MNQFSRSWELTKATFKVMKEDKEMFAFPVVAIFVGFIFLVLMGVVAVIWGIISFFGKITFAYMGPLYLFIVYLGISFISTFFSACVVYTAGVRFNGGNATFGQSI